MALDALPPELINHILKYLPSDTLTKMARVSKKHRDLAQSALWRSIELHRRDAHNEQFGLSTDVIRMNLDSELCDPWSYRNSLGNDADFIHHNSKFGTAIRKLYRSAGESQAWTRIAPFVRHICLTVTSRTPLQVWDMILSLPHLTALEVIGDESVCSGAKQLAQPRTLRPPSSTAVKNIRLRGYIPAIFTKELCKASASSINSLDLGILEPPKVYVGDKEDQEYQEMLRYPIFVGPRGVLWYEPNESMSFNSLKQVLLCKPGKFDGPPDMSEEENGERYEDEDHGLLELQQWTALLRSFRDTVVEIVLEQRPIYLQYLLSCDMEISTNDKTSFCPMFNSFDSEFYRRILKGVFNDGGAWPKLKKLTLRGINLQGFEEEAGETFESFVARALPGVQVQDVAGNIMFFCTRKGTIMNNDGVDGLKPQIDPYQDPFATEDDFDDYFF